MCGSTRLLTYLVDAVIPHWAPVANMVLEIEVSSRRGDTGVTEARAGTSGSLSEDALN